MIFIYPIVFTFLDERMTIIYLKISTGAVNGSFKSTCIDQSITLLPLKTLKKDFYKNDIVWIEMELILKTNQNKNRISKIFKKRLTHKTKILEFWGHFLSSEKQFIFNI